MLHHLDQPQNRPYDSYRRSIAPRRFKDLRLRLRMVLFDRDAQLHCRAQFRQIAAIHRHRQCRAQKRIANRRNTVLKRHQPRLSGLVRIEKNLVQGSRQWYFRRKENLSKAPDRPAQYGARRIHHHRPQRPADHDDSRRHLSHILNGTSLQHKAAHNSDRSHQQPQHRHPVQLQLGFIGSFSHASPLLPQSNYPLAPAA